MISNQPLTPHGPGFRFIDRFEKIGPAEGMGWKFLDPSAGFFTDHFPGNPLMPAVLVELGFGSNKLESQYMTDPEKQRQLATTLADAVVRYLEQYERKVGGSG